LDFSQPWADGYAAAAKASGFARQRRSRAPQKEAGKPQGPLIIAIIDPKART